VLDSTAVAVKQFPGDLDVLTAMFVEGEGRAGAKHRVDWAARCQITRVMEVTGKASKGGGKDGRLLDRCNRRSVGPWGTRFRGTIDNWTKASDGCKGEGVADDVPSPLDCRKGARSYEFHFVKFFKNIYNSQKHLVNYDVFCSPLLC
jgi:hypothetical protein